MKKSVSKKNILFLFVIISIMIMFSFCVSAELTRPIHGRQDITLRLYDKSIPALGNYIVGSSKGAIPESLNPGWGSYQLTAGTEEILENPAVLKIHHSVYQDVNNDISPGEMIVKLDDSTEEITPLSQISFTVGENWNSISWVKPCSLRILGWCLKRERGYISGTGKNIIEFPNYKKAGFLLLNIEHDNYFSEEAIRCGDRILMHWSNYDQYGGTEDKKWLEVSSDEETLNYPIRLNDVASSFYIYEQDGGCCSGYNQCSAGELNSEKCIGNKEYKCEEVYNSVGEPQCYAWVETGDLCSEVIPTTCPNSVCNSELGENCNNCEDCACESGETCLYSGVCEVIIHSVSCWDGYCNGLVGEDCRTCPSDCACELGENCNTIGTISNCVSDNPDIIECGDGNCDYLAGEDCRTCPSDCACKPELGEICNTIGTISNCIINPHVDCPNSVCGAGEDCTNCPSDCGVCPPGTCNNNGACNAELGENCNNCGDCACKTELGETCNAIGECINILVDCPDGQCGIEENCKNCEDCACDPASGKTCSDSGVCEGETPITCGDGSCRVEDGEDCNNCEDCDCGSDKVCNAIGECIDPLVKCGNSVCDPGENCNNCPDCKCDETKEYCNMGVCTKPPIPPVFDRINPTSCSELDTQSKCSNKLNWNDAVISTIEDHNSVLRANDFCGNKKYTITSGGCEGYFKCGCIWDMDYGRCLEYLDFTETKACTASADCYTDLNVLGDCKTEDEYTLKWTASWKDKNSGYKNEDTGCTDGQKTLPCPDKEVMVPFFNIVNLVVAIIAIILIYLAIKNRKKLFKKTNNNSGKKIKKKKKR